jgi:hypothetical protein
MTKHSENKHPFVKPVQYIISCTQWKIVNNQIEEQVWKDAVQFGQDLEAAIFVMADRYKVRTFTVELV